MMQETLGTKDPRLAEALYLERMGEIGRTWQAYIASQSGGLSRKTIAALAGEFYRTIVTSHEDEPGTPQRWLDAIDELNRRNRPVPQRVGASAPTRVGVSFGAIVTSEAMEFIQVRGFNYRAENVQPLLRAFFEAKILAYRTLARRATGDYSPEPDATRYPALERTASEISTIEKARVCRSLTVADHWDVYVKETGISLGTQKRFRPILIRCGLHLGTTNFADATTQMIERWVDVLAASGLAPKTVNESCLAAVRAFIGWGVTKKLISTNPCAGVALRTARTTKLKPKRPKGLTDDEATLILSETLREPDARMSKEFAAARRWVPWICAYTGARVNEITQMRSEDLSQRQIDGETVWVLLITPEAGFVKGREAREVPLHPHLIEQGFARFVRSRPRGPIFYKAVRARGGSEFNPAYQKVGEKLAAWVRDLGVTDEAVAPNHGWRHRFNTVARRCRIIPEIRDAIVGHAMRTEGEDYGDMIVEALYAEILRIPRFEVAKPEGRREPGHVARKRNVARVATVERAKAKREPQPPLDGKSGASGKNETTILASMIMDDEQASRRIETNYGLEEDEMPNFFARARSKAPTV